MEQYEILIIGGGPAGMMAAVSAAGQGAKVLLLERNSRLGRKLLITGKGRCNVTNNCDRDTLLNNIPRNPRFLYSAFAQFSPEDTMAFFESRGLPLKTERGNRVFPVSDKAADVERTLESAVRDFGAEIRTGRAERLILEDGAVKGVLCEDGT